MNFKHDTEKFADVGAAYAFFAERCEHKPT